MARMRIKDIAEQAGVSPATVSRYLNDRPGQMTEETRARIAEVIERTGYRPRASARNLRSEQSHMLGVILADIANPFSSAILEGLSTAADARGYALMTAVSANDPAREEAALVRLVDAGCDGIAVNTCGGLDEKIARTAARVPLVLLDRDVSAGGVDLVTSNNAQLVAGLVDELAQGGAERLVLLTEEADTSPVRRMRAEAFLAELARRGLAGEVASLGQGSDELDRLIVSAPGTRLGLIAVNGLVFLRLVESLAQLGPALPEAMHVATFDDYPWNRALFGGVTCAAQDTDAIATAVVDRLALRIDAALGRTGAEASDLAPVHLEVPGHVISRLSTR